MRLYTVSSVVNLNHIYVSRMNVVHRDIAARNITLTGDLVSVKISDFGMAKEMVYGRGGKESSCGRGEMELGKGIGKGTVEMGKRMHKEDKKKNEKGKWEWKWE